jgi:hypothetical protein
VKVALALLLAPFRLVRAALPFVWVILLAASLALNVAVLTVTGVYTLASGALSAVGIGTVASRTAATEAALRAERDVARRTAATATRRAEREAARAAQRKTTARIGRETARGVTRRVQRAAARNITSVTGEAIPVLGVAIIAGALAMEVNDACDTARDMAGLEAALASEGDPEAARKTATEAFDCVAMIREELPDYDDIPSRQDVWTAMRTAPAQAWEAARAAGIEVSNMDWAAAADGVSGYVWSLFDGLDALLSDAPPDEE